MTPPDSSLSYELSTLNHHQQQQQKTGSSQSQEEASNFSRLRNYSLHEDGDDKTSRFIENHSEPNSPDRERIALTDGGFLAWRFIVIAFLVEGFVWGLPQSFGVFLDFPPYSEMSPSMAAVIGTFCTGILYCIGSIVISLMERNPICAKIFPGAGTLVCSGSFLAASYSTKEWQLLAFQGIMYGIGGALLYYPALYFLSEWWVVRRGFAGGIMFAGASVFGLIIPPVLDWSLGKYGTPKTLRGLGVTFLVGIVPILPFFRGRLAPSSRRHGSRSLSRQYFKRPIFWAFMFLNLLQSLAFFVPTLYMPTYATSIGSPGGLVLAIFAAASIVGQIITGYLSDHFDLSWIIGFTSITSSVSIFVLWGYSEGFSMLAAFAIVYGISAGGFSCLWQRFAMVIAPSEPNSGSLVVYFATSRGIANVLTGPIAGFLLQTSSSKNAGYKLLVYYSGSLMMVCTSIGVATKWLYKRS